VTLKDAQALFPYGDVVSGVELKLNEPDKAPQVGNELHNILGGTPFRLMDWQELNHNLFAALEMQKTTLVIFLTLIIVVAAFNVIASLTVLVIDKNREIAMLKSMGMRSFGVARIFQVAGLTIGAVGTVVGVCVGLLLCRVVEHYGYQLDPRVYLIDHLPVRVRPAELLLTISVTLVICLLATIYPAIRAALANPVDGLREE
jgi:lipoprotein-releasing system permease protein